VLASSQFQKGSLAPSKPPFSYFATRCHCPDGCGVGFAGTKARFLRHSRLSSRIQAQHPFVVHRHAFATQQRRDPAIAIAGMGDVIRFYHRSTKPGELAQPEYQKMYDEGIQIAPKYFGE
jgi:hypothetical protein